MVCDASRRLYAAEVGADAAKDVTLPSARDHLSRVKQIHSIIEQRLKAGLDVSRVQLAQATYFLREAELWLAQAGAKP